MSSTSWAARPTSGGFMSVKDNKVIILAGGALED